MKNYFTISCFLCWQLVVHYTVTEEQKKLSAFCDHNIFSLFILYSKKSYDISINLAEKYRFQSPPDWGQLFAHRENANFDAVISKLSMLPYEYTDNENLLSLFKESLKKLTTELGGPPVNADAFFQACHGIDSNGITHALTVPSNVTATGVPDTRLVVGHPIHLHGKGKGFISKIILCLLYSMYMHNHCRIIHISHWF